MFDHLYDIINFFYEQLETNFILFFLLYLFLLIIFFSLSLPGGPVLIISSGFFFWILFRIFNKYNCYINW